MHARDLVLLHGQPGSHEDWLGVLEILPAGLRAHAVDRPGYGASPYPPGGFGANARIVLDGLDARGIDRAVLVGHSYGGGVALAVAALAPERVEALVLVASVGPGCLTFVDHLLAAPVLGELMSFMAFAATPPFARARLAFAERRGGRPLRPYQHLSWQIWGRSAGVNTPLWRTFLLEQRALVDELDRLDATLGSIAVPALVVADPSDGVIPVDTSRTLAATIPDAELILVSGAGHHIPRRRPAELVDAIGRFLTALDDDTRQADTASA